MTRNLYLFLGRSGSGKTSVVHELCQRLNLTSVSSFTDRPPRYEGEKDHVFVSPEEFDLITDQIAFASFGGYRYCTTSAVLDNSDCFVIEPKGVIDLKRSYTARPIVVVGIYAPIRILEERMRQRGDSEDAIKTRLENDEITFGMADDLCDVIFVNRDKETTVQDLCAFIRNREKAHIREYVPNSENHQQVIPRTQPLSVEQMQDMGGKPYWHVGLQQDSPPPHWVILDPMIAKNIKDYFYGERWIAYPYPAVHIDQEAWKPCKYCDEQEDPCFIDNCFRKNRLKCKFTCEKYRAYQERKNTLKNSRFCPKCGRPLTPDAWAELTTKITYKA